MHHYSVCTKDKIFQEEKNVKKFIKRFVIFLASLIGIYIVLLIPKVDKYITKSVNSLYTENPLSEFIIMSEDTDTKLQKPPLVYIKDEYLYVLYKGRSIDITPEKADIELMSEKYDITASLSTTRNCRISEDGSFMVYILKINDIDTLYKVDFSSGNLTYIDSKVDSFSILSNGSIIYATGYIYANNVYIHKDETNVNIGKNAKAIYMPKYKTVVICEKGGNLIRYDEETAHTELLDKSVDDMYNPFTDKYNYTITSDSFVVYYKKGSFDYVYKDGKSEKTSTPFNETKYTNLFETNTPGRYFYYSDKSKSLYLISEGKEYGLMHDAYKVYQYDKENERFIVATSKAVYLSVVGETNRITTYKMFKLKGFYKKNIGLIRDHMNVWTSNYTDFYISELSGGSFILNIFNSDSWLNKASVFKYKLSALSFKNNNFTSKKELSVPMSRVLADTLISDKNNVNIYRTFNKDLNCIGISLISGTKVLKYNLFEDFSSGDIKYISGENYTYFSIFNNDKDYLYVLTNEPSEIYKGNFTIYDSIGGIYLVTEDKNSVIYMVDGLRLIKIDENALIGIKI